MNFIANCPEAAVLISYLPATIYVGWLWVKERGQWLVTSA